MIIKRHANVGVDERTPPCPVLWQSLQPRTAVTGVSPSELLVLNDCEQCESNSLRHIGIRRTAFPNFDERGNTGAFRPACTNVATVPLSARANTARERPLVTFNA